MKVLFILGLACLTQINLSSGLECNICDTMEDVIDTCDGNLKSLNSNTNATLATFLSKVNNEPKTMKDYCFKFSGSLAKKDVINRGKMSIDDSIISGPMCNGKLKEVIIPKDGAVIDDVCICNDRDFCNGSIRTQGSAVAFVVGILGFIAAKFSY